MKTKHPVIVRSHSARDSRDSFDIHDYSRALNKVPPPEFSLNHFIVHEGPYPYAMSDTVIGIIRDYRDWLKSILRRCRKQTPYVNEIYWFGCTDPILGLALTDMENSTHNTDALEPVDVFTFHQYAAIVKDEELIDWSLAWTKKIAWRSVSKMALPAEMDEDTATKLKKSVVNYRSALEDYRETIKMAHGKSAELKKLAREARGIEEDTDTADE